jgi:hypothetical protein
MKCSIPLWYSAPCYQSLWTAGLEVAKMGRTKLQKYFSYGRSCYVCNARRNTWARLRKIALADLMDQKWILYPPNSEPAATVEKAFGARGLGLPRASVIAWGMVWRTASASTAAEINRWTQGLFDSDPTRRRPPRDRDRASRYALSAASRGPGDTRPPLGFPWTISGFFPSCWVSRAGAIILQGHSGAPTWRGGAPRAASEDTPCDTDWTAFDVL